MMHEERSLMSWQKFESERREHHVGHMAQACPLDKKHAAEMAGLSADRWHQVRPVRMRVFCSSGS